MNDKIKIQDTEAEPPQAPEIERKLRFYSFQWIGIPLLFLLPILAALGVFGESFDKIDALGEEIAVTVDYATRYRYKQINPMQVIVENISDSPLDTVTVHFEREYVDKFSTVTFKPAVKVVTGQSYDVEFTDIPPGEIRVVTAELQGERYGNHIGTVNVDVNGAPDISVDVATFIFP